jgi:hypothetical protein
MANRADFLATDKRHEWGSKSLLSSLLDSRDFGVTKR